MTRLHQGEEDDAAENTQIADDKENRRSRLQKQGKISQIDSDFQSDFEPETVTQNDAEDRLLPNSQKDGNTISSILSFMNIF